MNLKALALFVVLIGMAIPVTPLALAVTPAHAATSNNIIVGYYTSSNTFVAARYNVSVQMGPTTPNVYAADSKSVSTTAIGTFALNFSQVIISSGEVTLYLSSNGYAQISSTDIPYLSVATSLVNSTTMHTVTETINGVSYTWHVGDKLIVGPIPYEDPPQGLYYVKAFFGSSAPVATSIAEVNILPSLEVSPTSGPVGTTVTISGYGYSAGGTVNVSAAYNGKKLFTTNVTASSSGTFTYTFTAPELALETPAPKSPTNGNIKIAGYDYMSGYNATSAFTENGREFLNVTVYNPMSSSWHYYIPTLTAAQGNGTLTSVSFYEMEPLIVAGNYFAPNSKVSLYFGSTLLGSATTNGTGFFNTTVTVPVAPLKALPYEVKAVDQYGFIYFNGSPVTELVLSATKVTPGSSITISGYAWPASTTVNVTLITAAYPSSIIEKTIATLVSTSSVGTFSVPFTVPMIIVGGNNNIYANTTTYSELANFTVVPLVTISPSTASLGSKVSINMYGLDVGTVINKAPGVNKVVEIGATAATYEIAYDNIPTYLPAITGNGTGYASSSISAVGVPMLHAVQLVSSGSLVSTAWLNVTGTTNVGNEILSQLGSVSSTVSSTSSTLLSEMSTVSSEVSSLSSSVSSISSSLSSDYNSLSSMLSSISSTLSGVSSSVSSISSSLSSDYNSLSSMLSSISSSVSSVQSSMSSISSSTSQISTLSSTVSSLTTYLLVVVVLAIIIIVLQIVALARRR